MKHAAAAVMTLVLCLPGIASSASPGDVGIREEIRADLDEAREEIRTELATARAALDTENLDVGDSLQFNGDKGRKGDDAASLPKAEITPMGDFLVGGKQVAIDAGQRRQLLTYRRLVIDVAKAGIDIGEVTALAAVDAVDRGAFSLMLGAMTGSLERRIERSVRTSVGPGVLRICERMPALRNAQQQLAADLPAFRPYARLEAHDADNCRNDVERELAQR